MRKNTLIHLLIIIFGSIFIFLSIFHKNLWFDEAYSVGMANQTFSDIWNIGSNDVHPILYYFVLRIINILTNGSIICYRVFSCIPIILLGILGITHIRKDFGEKTGIIFSFLSFFTPIMSVYANQIRMYSWAAYILTIFFIYSNRIYKGEDKNKNWIIFTLSSFASIYIHYYSLLSVGIVNILLLFYFIKKKKYQQLKKQILIGIILIVLFLPWAIKLFLQIKHVSKGFWIGYQFPETLLELIGFEMSGIMNSLIGFIINIVLFSFLGIIYYRKRKLFKFESVKNSVKIYLLIIIIASVLSIMFKTSILHYRYLFVIIGLYIFIISYIVSKINKRHIIVFCFLIFVLGAINNFIQIQENYSKENGKQIKYLKENIKEDDVIVYTDNQIGAVIATNFENNKQYFYNPEDWGVSKAYKVWYPQMETYINKEFLNKCTNRVWIIDSTDYKCYDLLFKNKNFKFVSSECFKTKYYNYIYNIILVKRIY